jgi:hypothetical protein
MSNEKRAALSKKERAAAVSAKRRHDPNPERQGKPINVSNFGKGKLSEDMKQLDEKNVPTSPEKWAQAKAQAKAKFDVYPSAYANGWAAKKYKEMGGGWKSVNEEAEESDTEEKVEMVESQLHFIKYACEEILDYIKMGGEIEEWYQVKVAKSFSEFESLHAFIEGESRRTGMKEEAELEESFKVGDLVRPDAGPHKGAVHEVIHVHDDGSVNIKPHRMPTKMIKYGLGAAKAQPHQLKKVNEETEQLDEISYKSLQSYRQAAHTQIQHHKFGAGKEKPEADDVIAKREKGMASATAKVIAKDAANRKPMAPQKSEPYKPLGSRDEKSGRSYSESIDMCNVCGQTPCNCTNLHESRKAQIVREALDAAKKKKMEKQETKGDDKFNADPTLSSEIVKT